MTIKIEDGCLRLDIVDLLDGLAVDEKLELADSLAVTDDVIQAVAQQILHGWTEAGSHGCNDSDKSDPHYPLGKATRRVALGADKVAARQVASICRTLKWQEADKKKVVDWAWGMYNMMADANRQDRPCPPPPMRPRPSPCPEEYVVVRKDDAESAGWTALECRRDVPEEDPGGPF